MSKTDVETIPFEFKPGIPHLPYEVQLEQHRRRTTNVDVIADHMMWQTKEIERLNGIIQSLKSEIEQLIIEKGNLEISAEADLNTMAKLIKECYETQLQELREQVQNLNDRIRDAAEERRFNDLN